MGKKLTEIIFILDRSGSMSGLESDTIGGFNSFLKQQKKMKGEAKVTTVLFDDHYELLHNDVDIKGLELTENDYYTRGSTALLDAIGKTITNVSKKHKSLKDKHLPDKTIFVITTDGYENASTEFTYRSIHRMIDKKQKKDGWEFLFIGANIDEKAEAKNLNISPKNAMAFEASAAGVAEMYEELSYKVASMRKEN